MSPDDPLERRPPTRRIRPGPGGVVLALAAVVAAGVLAWGLTPIVRGGGSHAIGDGADPATYGFALEPLLGPRAALAASGFPRDGVRALVDPATLPAALANDREALGVLRGRYLVPSQRVVGVTIGGEARAYPLRVLNWHEVINDEIRGVPFAVTYSPLTDSVAVWDRRIDGRTVVFGVSGLLLDSNTLLYDREAREGSSLWAQFTGRAVAGPAAARGAALQLLPAVVEPWGAWLDEHPQTTVVKPDPALFKLYRRDPYRAYYGDERLRFPVEPLWSPGHPGLKERILAVPAGGRWWVLSWPWLRDRSAAGRRELLLGGERFVVSWHPREPSAAVRRPDGTPVPTVSGMWFAWHALLRAAGPPALPRGTGHDSDHAHDSISRSVGPMLNYRLIKHEPVATRSTSGRWPRGPNAGGNRRPAARAG